MKTIFVSIEQKWYQKWYSYTMTKKYKNLIKYTQLTKAILGHIVESILVGYSAIESRKGVNLNTMIDALDYLLKSIKEKKLKKKKVLRALKDLEKKEIIYINQKNDKVYVSIRDKNNPKIIEYSIKSLIEFKIKKKKWNGKWFLVFFDVPEIQRNKRIYLRRFLKSLGFYRYQKSVYIFPYECEKEVTLIKKIVKAAKYMKYVVAEKIEDEDKIKQFFSLK